MTNSTPMQFPHNKVWMQKTCCKNLENAEEPEKAQLVDNINLTK